MTAEHTVRGVRCVRCVSEKREKSIHYTPHREGITELCRLTDECEECCGKHTPFRNMVKPMAGNHTKCMNERIIKIFEFSFSFFLSLSLLLISCSLVQ